jgi:hypothetical protein
VGTVVFEATFIMKWAATSANSGAKINQRKIEFPRMRLVD